MGKSAQEKAAGKCVRSSGSTWQGQRAALTLVAVRKEHRSAMSLPCRKDYVDMMLTGLLQPLWPVLPPMACAWII